MSDRKVQPSTSGKFLSQEDWEAMKAAGFTEQQLQEDQPFGPMIVSYSRADAIRDGVLVDVTELARKAGFKIHTVMTCGVVQAVAGQFDRDEAKQAALLAVLQELHQVTLHNIVSGRDSDRVFFDIGLAKLWALCGPGDQGEPVLTVMLEGED
jgi:hypothetical protein